MHTFVNDYFRHNRYKLLVDTSVIDKVTCWGKWLILTHTCYPCKEIRIATKNKIQTNIIVFLGSNLKLTLLYKIIKLVAHGI